VKKPLEILRHVFGYHEFRPGQEDLVRHILERRDVLGVMPTGAGKSLCYQVPALLQPGITVVLSPLISLMKDQVDALRANGVAALALHSALEWDGVRELLTSLRSGSCPLLYIAPERLENAFFLNLLASLPVQLFVVDEAHCVSQWGHDFRPAYLRIAPAVAALPSRPTVAAFTATATPEVRDDVIRKLALQHPFVLTTGFDRPNLFFRVEHPGDKGAFLRSFVARRPRDSGIVYCATRKAVESVCTELRHEGVAAVRYHAGLEDEERTRNQEDFLHDRAAVMVATNAFGMGIDKSNVRYVLHYNMPKNLESYYQEAGRGGRDGEPAECSLLFAPRDVVTARYLISRGGDQDTVRRELGKLQEMVAYCHTAGCLRERLLAYFGDRPETVPCGQCGHCRRPTPTPSRPRGRDMALEAKKILSCVYRMEERSAGGHFGPSLLVQVLRGSRCRRVRELGFDTLSTWGLLKDTAPQELRRMVEFLVAEGLLTRAPSDDSATGLSFTATTRPFLRSTTPLYLPPESAAEDEAPRPKLSGKELLFEKLRALRRSTAQEQGLPPFVIFPDSTLREMCRRLPATAKALLEISGVGHAKLERYGVRFLEVINRWVTGPREDDLPPKPPDNVTGKTREDDGA